MAHVDLTPPLDDEAALAALDMLSLHQLAAAADAVRAEHHGDEVGYRRANGDAGVETFRWSPGDAPADRLAGLRTALATPGVATVRLERADGGASGSGIDDLTTVAWARLVVPGSIHLEAPWTAFGGKLGQVALEFGVDDLGAVAGDDDEAHLRRWVEEAGRTPARRDG